MDRDCVIQGRKIGASEAAFIRQLIAENPSFTRYKLSRTLCDLWNWRDPKGQLKDMAARALLNKMEERGWIGLPVRRRASPNRMRFKQVAAVDHSTDPITAAIADLLPLEVQELSQQPEGLGLYEWLLHRYHYLSYTSSVGLNLKYLVRDRRGRPLSCLLFGSAAWKCAVRDQFIGWSRPEREAHLQEITNNARFVLLPWVKVSSLASHVLGQVLKRLRLDWEIKYARRLSLVETFVDSSRFQGGCYRAANWIGLGQTTGRTRQDRGRQISVPPKRVFVYPLSRSFRADLRS
jgi:hypothetical protein